MGWSRILSAPMSESKPPTIAPTEEEPPIERQPPIHSGLLVIGISSLAAVLIGLVAVLFEKLESLGELIGKYVSGETGQVTGIWPPSFPRGWFSSPCRSSS